MNAMPMTTASAGKTEATTMTAMRRAAMKKTQKSICEISVGVGVAIAKIQTRHASLIFPVKLFGPTRTDH
jgi:hypothetical protein